MSTPTAFQKRALLFWIGCIGTRSLAAWLAYSRPKLLPSMAAIAAIIASGFTAIYIFGLRQTGAEVLGDRIWWNDWRPIHAALYGTFAYLAFNGHPRAWTILATDVVLGILAWTQNATSQ